MGRRRRGRTRICQRSAVAETAVGTALVALLSLGAEGCSAPERADGIFGTEAPSLAGGGASSSAEPVAPAAEPVPTPVSSDAPSRAAQTETGTVPVPPEPADADPRGPTEEQVLAELDRRRGAGESMDTLVQARGLRDRLVWCYALRGQGRDDDAEPLLREILDEYPGCRPARLSLARVLLARGEAASALAVLPAAPPEPAAEDAELLWLRAVATWRCDSDAAAAEGLMREQLATGPHPVAAAMELVPVLADRERHADALAVVDVARGRKPGDAGARWARVGLLRDLGRRDAAAAELRGLVGEGEVRSTHPQLLYELAWLEWLEGDRGAAAAALAAIGEFHKEHPWMGRRGDDVRSLAAEVAEKTRPSRLPVRDLLGNLRGAPLPSQRLRALAALCDVGGPVRNRAVVVALGDPSPAVRAGAVERAELPPVELERLCRAGFADGDWQVRAAAATACEALPAAVASTMLLDAMAVEQSSPAFAAMHRALLALAGAGPQLPEGAAADPDGRAQIVSSWRQHWGK